MTAVLHDEVITVRPVHTLTVVRDVPPAPAPKAAPRSFFGLFAGDPLVDGAARLLSVPVRHAYAALWRAGILEVQA
jgi:hypothetical protein